MASGTRSAQTRERLLTAAGAAFAQRGFHATTTRDIAAAAGMSPAAVYVHHHAKEDLLYLIASEGHLQTRALIREAVASSDDPATQLQCFMRDFAQFHAEQHEIARVINYELASLAPDHRDEIDALRRAIRRDVRGIVDRGLDSGAFDIPDPRMATMALLSLGIDIARWFQVDANWPPTLIASFYSDLAGRIVGLRTQE